MTHLEAEVAALRAEGVPDTARVYVTHFFSHAGASPHERALFRDALSASGFGTGPHDIGTDEETTGDGYWHHWSFTTMDASGAALDDADERAATCAAQHEVRYDGWEVTRRGDAGLVEMSIDPAVPVYQWTPPSR